jgi:hypothetical protein
MRRTSDEILMRRYLLGELAPEERASLESRYLADAEVFEEIAATENDLIDSYVRGELAEVEKQKFEAAFFISPQRRERVGFARALNQVFALAKPTVPPQRSSWKKVWTVFSVEQGMPQWALAVAAVVVVAGGYWLMVQNYKLRVGLQQALAENAQLRRGQDTIRQHIAELEGTHRDQFHENQQGSAVAKLEPPIGPEVTFRLTPGIARSFRGPQKTLVLPTTASRLQLQLMLDRDDYDSYEAVLLTAELKEVLRGKALHSRSIGGDVVVTWPLSVHSVHSGDYIVQLAGQTASGRVEDVESYSFRLFRR